MRNLSAIKADLQKIEDELDKNGLRNSTGSSSSGSGKGKGKKGESEVEKQVREVGESYDRLVGMLSEDDGGRERAKALIRVPQQIAPPTPPPEIITQPPSDPFADTHEHHDTQSPPVPSLTFEPPTPGAERVPSSNGHRPSSKQGMRPFRDDPDEDEENVVGFGADGRGVSDGDLMDQQQVMMEDQDERLNLLSNSIHRQQHLSIQIGDELDVHHQLLEETDSAMDRTAARLGRARKRLDKVANDAKQYGSTITIVGLILLLLILIIVFKT